MRDDLTDLPPSTAEDVRTLLKRAGLELPQELLQQFLAVWPQYEAMTRRIPRSWSYADEPAHTFRPNRLVGG
ncbi:MAG TPA: hypothetical protein VM782_03555 [Stellaceae bacterium]|nr:hypothetical protein [Stellaceae bacterium]